MQEEDPEERCREKRGDVGVHDLEENSEAEEDAAKEDGHAGGCAGDIDRSSSTSGAGATSSGGSSSTTEASNGNRRRCGSCSGG